MLKLSLDYRLFNMQLKYLLHIAACVVIVLSSHISSADSNLPDIGDPSSADFSPAKEIELGRALIAEVRGRLPVTNDPELSQYIQSLGTRITSGGVNSNFPFTFLLVFNSDVNAFALPGGIVVINSGLLTLGKQESEVASVLAHEIAHVTQRHIARNFFNSKSLNVISALTFLGSILAAAYGSDLGKAAIITTQAGIQQKRLAYSRGFEQEADRIGMQLLVSSSIDPQGMPLFFDRLNKHTQLNRGQIPEFLSSHPLTADRVSESKARADQYKGSFTTNTIHFEYAKARTIAMTSNPIQLIDHFRKKSKLSDGLSDIENYTYAGALSRTGKNKQAARQLEKVVTNVDNTLTIKLAKAQINIAEGQINKARELLESLDKIYPNNFPVVYYLAMSLIEENQGKVALQKLDQLSSTNHLNPSVDKLKAKAANKANMPWRSHESLGDFYAAYGQYGEAMEQIQLSLRSHGIDSNSKARVEAKKIKLKESIMKREEFK